jgi:hypothetical protein
MLDLIFEGAKVGNFIKKFWKWLPLHTLIYPFSLAFQASSILNALIRQEHRNLITSALMIKL